MNMPGFTAEASLNGVSKRYRMAGTTGALAGGEGVVPQLGTTMQEWWDEWMGEGGGSYGGGGGYSALKACEDAANQRYQTCLSVCDRGPAETRDSCKTSCWFQLSSDSARCRR
jgi:hypothetical protein